MKNYYEGLNYSCWQKLIFWENLLRLQKTLSNSPLTSSVSLNVMAETLLIAQTYKALQVFLKNN